MVACENFTLVVTFRIIWHRSVNIIWRMRIEEIIRKQHCTNVSPFPAVTQHSFATLNAGQIECQPYRCANDRFLKPPEELPGYLDSFRVPDQPCSNRSSRPERTAWSPKPFALRANAKFIR